MKTVEELKAALIAGSESAIEPSLAFVAQSMDPVLLRDLAIFALAAAIEKPHAMAYGPRMMIAGASIARAEELEPSSAEEWPDDRLLTELNALQAELEERELRRQDVLPRFAPLGAQLSRREHRPFLDLEVEAKNDDSVLLWSSGAAALGAWRRDSTSS